MLKVGGYGIFRFGYTLFPAEMLLLSPALVFLALLGYLYSTVAAVRQQDLKRYVAYTSIAHMNFGLIGLFTGEVAGLEAFIFTMLSHGLIATGMFLVIGYFYAFSEFRDTVRLRGLASLNPKLSVFWVILSLANMGMPLFAGFPGEYFTLVAATQHDAYLPWAIFIGFYLAGAYTFFHLTRFLYGSGHKTQTVELTSRTLALFCNLTFWVLLLGLVPTIVLGTLELGAVETCAQVYSDGAGVGAVEVVVEALDSTKTLLPESCPPPTGGSGVAPSVTGEGLAPTTAGAEVGVGKLNLDMTALLAQGADLEFELDTYEWFCLLRPEVDTTVTINRDLAYRYGQEYVTGLLSEKIGEGQHLYQRGLAQEVRMLLPMASTVTEVLSQTEFETSDSTRLQLVGVDSNAWGELLAQYGAGERYFEFGIQGVDSLDEDLLGITIESWSPSYGAPRTSISHAVDTERQYLASIDNNPGIMQDLSN